MSWQYWTVAKPGCKKTGTWCKNSPMEDKQVIKDKEGIPQILRVHHIFSRAQGRKKKNRIWRTDWKYVRNNFLKIN